MTSIGLPQGWETCLLDSLCDRIGVGLAMGITQHYAERGTKLLRNQNIRPDRFDDRDILFLTEEFSETQNSKKLRANDVITVRTGSNIGDTCVVPASYEGALTFTTLMCSPTKDRLDPFFLSFYVNSQYGRAEVNRLMAGGGKGNLNSGELKKFQLLTPTFSEQQKIAAILSKWDRAIELIEKLIAAKQKRKQALMQQLLTGKVRFAEFQGQWKTNQIGKFLSESRQIGSHGEDARKITVKLYAKGVVPKVETRKGSAATQYYRRSAGQFIYSKLDFLNGAFGIVPDSMDGFESTLDLPAFDISDDIDHRWFFYYVSREAFYKKGFRLANGGRKARRVNPKDFLRIRVPTPDYSEQRAIAEVIAMAEKELTLLSSRAEGLKRQKKGLMQQLLTGKVLVNVDAELVKG